jgi:hypothetical protein
MSFYKVMDPLRDRNGYIRDHDAWNRRAERRRQRGFDGNGNLLRKDPLPLAENSWWKKPTAQETADRAANFRKSWQERHPGENIDEARKKSWDKEMARYRDYKKPTPMSPEEWKRVMSHNTYKNRVHGTVGPAVQPMRPTRPQRQILLPHPRLDSGAYIREDRMFKDTMPKVVRSPERDAAMRKSQEEYFAKQRAKTPEQWKAEKEAAIANSRQQRSWGGGPNGIGGPNGPAPAAPAPTAAPTPAPLPSPSGLAQPSTNAFPQDQQPQRFVRPVLPPRFMGR